MKKNQSKTKLPKKIFEHGYVPLILAAAAFGMSGTVVSFLGRSFNDLANVSVRGLTVVLTILLLLALQKKWPKLPGHINKKWFIFFLILQPLGNLAFVVAIKLTHDANSTVFFLYIAQILIGLCLGHYLNDERFTKRTLIIFEFAILGIISISYDSLLKNLPLLGIIAALSCGASEATKNFTLKKMGVLENKKILTFYQYFSAFLVCGLALLLFKLPALDKPLTTPSIIGIIIAAVTAIIITWGTKTGFENVDTNTGNIILTSELAFAAIANAIFLQQIITPLQIIGVLLLATTTIVINNTFQPN